LIKNTVEKKSNAEPLTQVLRSATVVKPGTLGDILLKKLNMRKICFLLLLISNLTWSQNNKIQGVIKDSETFQPIPYVHIYSESLVAS
jgi:hypothetical protein